jgi:Ran GTPase-activating protein (RanGAP) involved in mRNA processing and transport
MAVHRGQSETIHSSVILSTMSTLGALIDGGSTLTSIHLTYTTKPQPNRALASALVKAIISRPGLQSFMVVLDDYLEPAGVSRVFTALSRSYSLTSLRLPDFGRDSVARLLTGALIRQHNLRELDVRHNNLGYTEALAIASLIRDNTNLAHLRVAHSMIGDHGTEAIALSLQGNSNLHDLDLTHCNITHVGASHLSDMLRFNTGLQRLHLMSNHIQCVGAGAIADSLAQNDTLLLLDISMNGVGTAGAIALSRALPLNTRLEHLRMGISKPNFNSAFNHLGGNGDVALAASIGGPDLRSVSLAWCSIHLEDIVALSGAFREAGRLEHLDLSCNNLGDVGVETLALALRVHRCLVRLDLASNKIGDAGAVALANVLRLNTPLRRLVLCANRVGHTGVSAIARSLQVNTNLQKLDLYGNAWGTAYCRDPLANGDTALCELLEFTLLRPMRTQWALDVEVRLEDASDRLAFLLQPGTGRLLQSLTASVADISPAVLPHALATISTHPWLVSQMLHLLGANLSPGDSGDGDVHPCRGAPSVSKRPRTL